MPVCGTEGFYFEIAIAEITNGTISKATKSSQLAKNWLKVKSPFLNFSTNTNDRRCKFPLNSTSFAADEHPGRHGHKPLLLPPSLPPPLTTHLQRSGSGVNSFLLPRPRFNHLVLFSSNSPLPRFPPCPSAQIPPPPLSSPLTPLPCFHSPPTEEKKQFAAAIRR